MDITDGCQIQVYSQAEVTGMSYPYYYPCYSARVFEPTIHAQHTLDALHRSYLREEQIRIQQAARVGEEVGERQRVVGYEQELKDKQRIQQLMERSRIQADIEQSKMRLALMEERTKQDYLNGLRGVMDGNRTMYTGRKREDERQREMLVEAYQRELLEKIRGDDNKKRQEGKNVHFGPSVAGGSQPIINRKTDQKLSKQLCQFSNSAINATLQERTARNIGRNNYGTLDIEDKSNRVSQDGTPLKDKYMTHRYSSITKDKKPNKSLTARRAQRKRSNFNSVIKEQAETANRSREISEIGLKRIQNRLKVSAIIYKDSSRRNNKHQMQHLCNTYQNQLRLRQQMKDRINTNPQILKKHHMVVSAR